MFFLFTISIFNFSIHLFALTCSCLEMQKIMIRKVYWDFSSGFRNQTQEIFWLGGFSQCFSI